MSEHEAARAMREAAAKVAGDLGWKRIPIQSRGRSAIVTAECVMAENIAASIAALPIPDPSPAPASEVDGLADQCLAQFSRDYRANLATIKSPSPDPAPAMGDEEIVEATSIALWLSEPSLWATDTHRTVDSWPNEDAACQRRFRSRARAALAVASPILTQRARDKALEDAEAAARSVAGGYKNGASALKASDLRNMYRAREYGAEEAAVAIVHLKGTPHV